MRENGVLVPVQQKGVLADPGFVPLWLRAANCCLLSTEEIEMRCVVKVMLAA